MDQTFDEEEFRSIINPSPTYKISNKEKRKPPSKLALKRTLRRSLTYDKLIPSIENSQINMVDAESEETTSYTSSAQSSAVPVKSRRGFVVINDSNTLNSVHNSKKEAIIVNDSQSSKGSMKSKSNQETDDVIEDTDDEAELIPPTQECYKVGQVEPGFQLNANNLKQNDLLSEAKYESIKTWVQSISNAESKYADKAKVKMAVNSTFALDKTCLPFDEWMRGKHKASKPMKDSHKQNRNIDKGNKGTPPTRAKPQPETPNQWLKKYLKSDEVQSYFNGEDEVMSENTAAWSKKKSSNNLNELIHYNGDLPVKPKSKKGTLIEKKNKENLMKTPTLSKESETWDNVITPVKQIISKNEDVSNLLDHLYGNSWHKNKDQIFSEPKPSKKLQMNKLRIPQTEKKPQFLYQNPHLDSEQKKSSTLLKSLQKKRIQANIESPFFKKSSVDNDTPSSNKNRSTEATNDNDIISDIDKSLADKLKKKQLPKPTQLSFGDDNEKPRSKTKSNTKSVHKRIIVLSDSSESENETDTDVIQIESKNNCTVLESEDSSSSLHDSKPVRKTSKKKFDKKADDLVERIVNIAIDNDSSYSVTDVDSSSDSDKFIVKPKKGSKVVHKTKKPEETKIHSFLSSLSKAIPDDLCDPSALIYKKHFKKHRDALTRILFNLFNENIFGKCLAEDTPIEWSSRMTGTAGLCRCMCKTHRDGKKTRLVKFQLSVKVLDSADRLRDTLVHEMCHAATYIINEVSDGHGPFWKAWAAKAIFAFPELPPIRRCHDYAIHYKYTYRCTSCNYSFGRHSKSLDIERKRCGHCHGTFEVLLNKTTGADKKSVPCTPKKEATGFAKFVKENYAMYKSPGVSHTDVMKILSKKYAERKNDNK